MFGRTFIFLYGIASYAVFLVAFLYAIGFVGNLWVPKSIDTGSTGSLVEALIVDAVLLGIFAIQHSVMARPGFKRWWTRIIPEKSSAAPTFSCEPLAVAALLAMAADHHADLARRRRRRPHRTDGRVLARLGHRAFSTFLINHFNLFGLQQVFAALRNRDLPNMEFRAPLLYKLVRHPIMLGFLLAFWGTPDMTAATCSSR